MKQWVTQNGYKVFKFCQVKCNVFLISSEKHYILVDSGLENYWGELNDKLDNMIFPGNSGNGPLPCGTNCITRLLINSFGKKLQIRFNYSPVDYDVLVDDIYDLSGFGFKGYIIHTPGNVKGMYWTFEGDLSI